MHQLVGMAVPDVVFITRERDDSIDGPNPYRWKDMTSKDFFANKRVVLFSVPGAFTPTCSDLQLPEFEKSYEEFKKLGIDEVYCVSVNDAFTMNAWAKSLGITDVKVIPDGNMHFTSAMGMVVSKRNLGFGNRSWRYAAIINDCIVEQIFAELDAKNETREDPYEQTTAANVLSYLKPSKSKKAVKKVTKKATAKKVPSVVIKHGKHSEKKNKR